MYSRHVDADHRVLRVEHELGQRAGQLGLADAGRAEEQERADRPVRVAQAGARAAQGVGHGLDGLVLADDALVQALLHVDELLDLALHEARDRDAGPAADDLGDVLGVDLLLEEAGVGRRSRASASASALLELGDLAVAQLGGALQVGVALGALGLAVRLLEALLDLLRRRRSRPSRPATAAFIAVASARAGRRARARSPRGARPTRRRVSFSQRRAARSRAA